MWIISILLTLLIGFTTLHNWTYKLEFTAEGIHVSTIFRSFSHNYDTLTQFRRGPAPGFLEIVPRESKPFQLYLHALDGSTSELLKELSAHVAPGSIPANLEKQLKKDIVLANWSLGLVMITAGFAFLRLAINRGDFFLNYVAFTSVGAWDISTDVKVFSLDSAGTPWFVKSRMMRDNYTVQKVTDSGEQTWTMPFRYADTYEHGDPIGVASAPNGHFWVICEQSIFHWTGETWNQIPFPASETEFEVEADGIVITDSKLWATANPTDDYKNAETIFFSLDLLSNEMREIPMPDSAVQAGLNMHQHLHQVGADSILMLMQGQPESRLYLFENGSWQEPGYAIAVHPSIDLVDFTVDPSGTVWALLENRKGANTLTTVGEFDSDTLTWNWYRPKSDCALCSENYLALEVDTHRRVWLAGRYDTDNMFFYGTMLDIFEPQLDGTATHSERYTPENSNWQSSRYNSQLRRKPDGRMWTADDRLVWMDSTRETLPRPLPGWITVALSPIGYLFMSILYLLPMIANLIIYFKYQRDRSR